MAGGFSVSTVLLRSQSGLWVSGWQIVRQSVSPRAGDFRNGADVSLCPVMLPVSSIIGGTGQRRRGGRAALVPRSKEEHWSPRNVAAMHRFRHFPIVWPEHRSRLRSKLYISSYWLQTSLKPTVFCWCTRFVWASSCNNHSWFFYHLSVLRSLFPPFFSHLFPTSSSPPPSFPPSAPASRLSHFSPAPTRRSGDRLQKPSPRQHIVVRGSCWEEEGNASFACGGEEGGYQTIKY